VRQLSIDYFITPVELHNYMTTKSCFSGNMKIVFPCSLKRLRRPPIIGGVYDAKCLANSPCRANIRLTPVIVLIHSQTRRYNTTGSKRNLTAFLLACSRGQTTQAHRFSHSKRAQMKGFDIWQEGWYEAIFAWLT